jgi:hypothetical protein
MNSWLSEVIYHPSLINCSLQRKQLSTLKHKTASKNSRPFISLRFYFLLTYFHFLSFKKI